MKNVMSLNSLYEYNYTVNVINALKQQCSVHGWFSCFGSPKRQNLLLYMNNCKSKYTLKNGQVYYAEEGDIVYTAKNSEYTLEFFDFVNNAGTFIGINYFIHDESGNEIYLENDIVVIKPHNPEYFLSLFLKITEYSAAAVLSPSRLKAVFYQILSTLSKDCRTENIRTQKYDIISKGIQYLEENETQDLSIKEIASLCNISEIYFRKLFKLYSGVSPVQYKLSTQISKAKQYLETTDMSISAISESAGFSDPAYFSKVFKEKTGISPKRYREETTTTD